MQRTTMRRTDWRRSGRDADRCSAIVSVLAVLLVTSVVHAGTLRLQLGAENHWCPEGYKGVEEVMLCKGSPGANYGAFWEWQSGTTKDEREAYRALIRWDLRKLRPLFDSKQYQVVMAELRLGLWYNRSSQRQPFEVFRISLANAGWVEGGAKGKPASGTATWEAARSGVQPWKGAPGCGKPGVDYDETPVARFVSDSLTHMRPRYLSPIRLPLDMVRSWALEPERNAGLLIKRADGSKQVGSVNFVPSEHQRSDYGWDRHHPELVITYLDTERSAETQPGQLVSKGRSGHVVVVPNSPVGSERRAAGEFADHVKQISGCELTILPEDLYRPEYGPCVSIGRTARSEKVLSEDGLAALGEEGYVIDRRGQDLFIVGGRRRGSLYGVFEFLEGLGVRWLTAKFPLTPKSDTIALPARPARYVPKFFYRDQLWNNGSTPEWRARLRLNGEYARLPNDLGGSTRSINNCHSFHVLVPHTLRPDHPDWFALTEDGKRSHGSRKCVNLCTTNPEVRRYILGGVRSRLSRTPDAEHVWVSQCDGGLSGCFCKECTAERVKHGGEKRWSANIISLVNYIAREIKGQYPKVWVKTLAYSYTVDAPDNQPVADNVLVVLCGPPCTFHPIDTCEKNAEFFDNLKKWTKVCNGIQTYFYGGPNFGYHWPYPSWLAMCSDYPVAYKHGVRAVYRQGAAVGYGSEFTELRGYLTARMAWNPELDPVKELVEFTDGYYGPGAPHIRDYMFWYDRRVRSRKSPSGGFWGEADAWKRWVDEDVIAYGEACFAKALDATKATPDYHRHVRAAYLPILFARTMSAVPPQPEFRDGEYVLLPGGAGERVRKAAALFTEIMAESGYNRWNEPDAYNPDTNPIAALKRTYRYVVLDNGRDQAYVLPALGGRIVRWDVAKLGGNAFRMPDTKAPGYPYAGGYEEYSQFHRNSEGAMLDFKVVEHTDKRRLIMRAMLKNGLELTRTLELAKDSPRLDIASRYRNPTDKSVPLVLRNHPEFSFAQFKNAKLFLPGKDGTWQKHSLLTENTRAGDKSFEAASLSKPVWLFGDETRNRGLVNRFDPAVVKTLYAFWGENNACMNLELWGSEGKLEPGQTRELAHCYEITDDLRGFLDKAR